MYKGRRDPEIRIAVAQSYCQRYNSKTSGQWVEVFVPPELISEYNNQWGSIMVKPDQVCNIGDGYNIIRVNDGAAINCSVKDDQHIVISSETMTPDVIIGRWLKFYRYDLFRRCGISLDMLDNPSMEIYQDFARTGQHMQFYMNRMPLVI